MSKGVDHRDSSTIDREEHLDGAINRKAVGVVVLDANNNPILLKLDANGNLPTGAIIPTNIYTGKTTVTTSGTRVALASTQTVKSVTVKALSTNTGIVYVGDSTVSSSNGLQLSAGEAISLDIADLSTINLDAAVNGEGVTYLGVN